MRTLIFLLIAGLLVHCKSDDSVPPNEGLSFELNGLPADLDHALITLQSADTIIKDTLEAGDDHVLTVGVVDPGSYEVTLSSFEGEDLYQDFEEAQGTLFAGTEAIIELEVTGQTQVVSIRGPEASAAEYDFEPTWSDRYFHSINDPERAVLTLSFPVATCEFNIRFIPDYVTVQPEVTYIDYFIWSPNGGVEAQDHLECLENCDVIENIRSFESEVSDGDLTNCSSSTWEMIDSIIMLHYGDEAGDLVVFYQRWDADGNVVIPTVDRDASRVVMERRGIR